MSIPSREELKAEYDAMLLNWVNKFKDRFGYDVSGDVDYGETTEEELSELYDTYVEDENNNKFGGIE